MSAEPHLTDQDYELLSAYIDGALSESEQAMVEQRLKTDSLFQRELNALRQTVALINQLPTLKAPHNFTLDTSMVAVRDEARPAPKVIRLAERQRYRLPYGMLSAVAAVVVVIFGGVLLLTTSHLNEQPSTSRIMEVASNPTQTQTPALEQQRALKTETQEDEALYATAEDGTGASENAAGAAPAVNAQTMMVPETASVAPGSTGAGAPVEELRADYTAAPEPLPSPDALDMAADTEVKSDEVFSTFSGADEGTADSRQAEDSGTFENEDTADDMAVESAMAPQPAPTQTFSTTAPPSQTALGEADSDAEVMNAFMAPSSRAKVRVFVIENRPFKLADDGLTWVDVTYGTDEMPVTDVVVGSGDYDMLLQDYPELAAYTAKLGERIIVVLDRTAYHIHPPEGPSIP